MLIVYEIFTLFFLFVVFALPERCNVGLSATKNQKFLLISSLLILVIAFRSEYQFNDYWNYKSYFQNGFNDVEPTFKIITFFVKNVLRLDVTGLMFIYAAIAVILKLIVIKEYSSYPAISYLIFMGDLLVLHEMTQIRIAVSVGLLLLSIKYIYNRNLKKFLFVYFVAVLFHYSALIMLPLYFFNPKKIKKYTYIYVIIIFYSLTIVKFNPLLLIANLHLGVISRKVQAYISVNAIPANVFGLYTLSKLAILLLLLYKAEVIQKYNKYSIILLKIQTLSVCSLCLFSQNITFALRVSEFFTCADILLFPMFITIFKEKRMAKLIIIAFSIFWLYMRVFRYNLIHI